MTAALADALREARQLCELAAAEVPEHAAGLAEAGAAIGAAEAAIRSALTVPALPEPGPWEQYDLLDGAR